MQTASPATAFRIKEKETEETTVKPVIHQRNATTDRVVVGRVPDHWVCTMAQDFNTLTFGGVFDLFREAVFNPERTALVVNRFVSNTTNPEHFRFSEGAMRVLTEENAGGASEFSEAVSFELMHRLFHASLVKTEMSIGYAWEEWSKKTDYTMSIGGRKLAVSVTRAMKYHGTFNTTDAFNLLFKKLTGVQLSNRDVVECDRWDKQVLHIFCEHVYIVELLRSVYSWMYEKQPELIGNTVVLISLAVQAPFLFHNFCAEQSQMKFTCEAVVPTSEHTFTTAATSETCVAPHFAGEQENEDEFFFYGFPTKEEAILNNAIPILEAAQEECIFDEEGPLKQLGAWLASGAAWKQEIHQDISCRGSLEMDRLSRLQPYLSPNDKPSNNCPLQTIIESQEEGEEIPRDNSDCTAVAPHHNHHVAAAASCSSPPTREQELFPPQRLPLLAQFRRTFQHVVIGEEHSALDRLSCAHQAIRKRLVDYTPFSFADLMLQSTSQPDELGLAGMFDDEATTTN